MPGEPFCCSWSGGKDSCLALARAVQAGGQPLRLLTLLTEEGQRSRSHGLRREVLAAQAEALNVPLATSATTWDNYEASLVQLLRQARTDGISTAVFGDIDIPRHRAWEEMVCAAAGLTASLPLWQEDRHTLLREFWSLGYECRIVVAREGLVDPELLGRVLDEPLAQQLSAAGIDACGENGEFHTLVTGGPLFAQPLKLQFGQRVLRDGCWFIDVEPIAVAAVPVETLSKESLLALCDLELDAARQSELSDLLHQQREGPLSSEDRVRMDLMLAEYRRGLVLKARALKEAVDRGLRPALNENGS